MQITLTLSDADGQRLSSALAGRNLTDPSPMLVSYLQSFVTAYEAEQAAKQTPPVPAPVTVTGAVS